MCMTDPISDTLTRIRNAHMIGRDTVDVRASKIIRHIIEILAEEGYIAGFEEKKGEGGQKLFQILLKYHEKRPVIEQITRLSKSGCRVYVKAKEIPPVYQGLGISIISTSKGVLSNRQAAKLGVGGELLCSVF
ncbi:MAG: 30S ribosomal protein S8 [Magnetococcus sp. DMHC-6]